MKLIRRILSLVIVFQTINDNLMIDLFGPDILKINLAVFILLHLKYIVSFKYLRGQNLFFSLLMMVCLISLVMNINRFYDIQSPVVVLVAVFVYFVVFSQVDYLDTIYNFLLFGILISSLYCIFREETISEWTFRKTGGTSDPNEFSTMVLVGIALIWGSSIEKKGNFYIQILLIVLFLMSLLLAGSKSAFLVFGVLIIFGVYKFLNLPNQRGKAGYIFSTVLVILSTYFILQNYFTETLNLFVARFESSESEVERLNTWKAGFQLLANSLYFGVGPTNFAYMIEKEFLAGITEGSREAHNMFIKMLVENGVVGFVLFILFLVKPISILFYSIKKHPEQLMLLVLFLMGFTLSLTFEKYTWLVFAIVCNKQFKSQKNNVR